MDALLPLTLTGVAVFAATNLDDLLILAALFSQRTVSARTIVSGQYLGIGFLFAASALAAAAALAVPASWLAWLGLIPMAIGLRQLRAADTDDRPVPLQTGCLSVAGITVANGGDNLGVYIPLFSTSSASAIALWAVVFAIMTAVWCYAAAAIVRHPAWRDPIGHHGARLVPWVLIALGLWILFRG